MMFVLPIELYVTVPELLVERKYGDRPACKEK